MHYLNRHSNYSRRRNYSKVICEGCACIMLTSVVCTYMCILYVCTVLYVHTVFIGCILCNNSVLNAVEEVIHRCVVTLYGDVLVRRLC